MTTQLHVQIPATSANLGSGFDAVGIALAFYNDMYFTEEPDRQEIVITLEGLGQDSIPTCFDDNLVGQAMKAVAVKNRQFLPKGGTLRLVNRIPPSRGLGSSSAALIGGIILGNALTGSKMTKEDMLSLATVMEGHPDNVAPALYGGLAVSIMVDGRTMTNSIPIEEDLSFVTVSPQIEVSTEKARQALPKTIEYQSAVFNVSRVSFLISSLFTKQYDRLQYGLQDRLHVPYRIRLIPGGSDVLQAAVNAGALGATISGSGSTLIAFAAGQEDHIMHAMIHAFSAHGVEAEGHILKCSNEGARIIP
ncbi:serine kinase [Megasphaera cerevisiae DSM 20462]|jgi:homoserine kinase|uniref:Homoserine kinase n=1 Tax=Megasphaera cerevisiae DSM 20462 TaxID=1122219 RepID=A0A0J6WYU2_9FIRM|nr:homoserine kinase [Megasphaera cerevisiae]KMO87017.1 serine kinase [Megasphaera cerevisiae DSM 20462]MCI1750555.1 homoserine kinase [Megasphaera cerevisiae]OKY54050.1 homoserine kinase [Megasphaera cerevisiae]SJZ81907.1 homoserine kinase [Megasphaera cerevisiae DSM 20462]